MRTWEYKKVDLNQVRRRADDIDVLDDAGRDGWELAAILPNNVAYLKRMLVEVREHAVVGNSREEAHARAEVKPKYRDPATAETWSGRGRMATWLKRKQDGGENIDDYLV